MSGLRDYYRILHVQPDAPTEIISASYRTLMQRLRRHPDLGGDHDTAVLLNEAHAVLTDPLRRAAYDASRARACDAAQPAPDPRFGGATPAPELFAGSRCTFCGAPHGIERPLAANDECASCSSPLFPAERHRLEYSGQRMLSRIPKAAPITFYTSWPQAAPHDAELRDLSLNGLQLSSGVPVEPYRIVKVDGDVCRALARVAHCRRDPADAARWLIGLEFLTLRFANAQGNFVSTSA